MFGATIVMAAVANEEKNFFVNGKGYAIKPVLIENILATHTDNFYVPLRKTFEALGYRVSYDVDKEKYLNHMGKYSFPAYDAEIYTELEDEEGNMLTINLNGYEWKRGFVTNDVNYYIYGATHSLNDSLPIIEMTKDGKTEFCQIGSWDYSNGYAIAPVLIEGTAYIPLRAVANIVGGSENVKWNEEKHDTYFEGTLTFNEEENVVTVNLP